MLRKGFTEFTGGKPTISETHIWKKMAYGYDVKAG